MNTDSDVRRLLVESCHSSADAERQINDQLQSPEFIERLVSIAVDDEDYQGDAPMRAAYYLSKAGPELLISYESRLLLLLETADGYGASIALTLARMGSSGALPEIARRVQAGWWPEHTYKEALVLYVVV